MRHKNILQCYGVFEDESTIYMVLEFAANEDLMTVISPSCQHFPFASFRCCAASVLELLSFFYFYFFLKQLCAAPALQVLRKKYILTEAQTRDVISGLLVALEYLHSKSIIHRDIKPENILFMRNGQLKLADLGAAIDMREERPVSRLGTLDYMAPEVLRCPDKRAPTENKDRADLEYGVAVDNWAVGVLAFELITGSPPFEQDTMNATIESILTMQEQLPLSVSESARRFIRRALHKQPEIRPAVRQLLTDPFIASVSPEDDGASLQGLIQQCKVSRSKTLTSLNGDMAEAAKRKSSGLDIGYCASPAVVMPNSMMRNVSSMGCIQAMMGASFSPQGTQGARNSSSISSSPESVSGQYLSPVAEIVDNAEQQQPHASLPSTSAVAGASDEPAAPVTAAATSPDEVGQQQLGSSSSSSSSGDCKPFPTARELLGLEERADKANDSPVCGLIDVKRRDSCLRELDEEASDEEPQTRSSSGECLFFAADSSLEDTVYAAGDRLSLHDLDCAASTVSTVSSSGGPSPEAPGTPPLPNSAVAGISPDLSDGMPWREEEPALPSLPPPATAIPRAARAAMILSASCSSLGGLVSMPETRTQAAMAAEAVACLVHSEDEVVSRVPSAPLMTFQAAGLRGSAASEASLTSMNFKIVTRRPPGPSARDDFEDDFLMPMYGNAASPSGAARSGGPEQQHNQRSAGSSGLCLLPQGGRDLQSLQNASLLQVSGRY